MPLYEVVLEQRYANQQSINRWNYLGSGTPAAVVPSFALLSALGFLGLATTLTDGTVGGELQSLQNQGVTFVQATCRAVYIDDDFYANPFLANTKGAVNTFETGLSPLVAYGFRSNRVKQSIGRGYKRFIGADETMQDTGGLLNAAANAQALLLANAMSDVVTYDDEGNTLSFSPCIAQKLEYTTPSGKTAYKYYSTELLQAPHLAVGINWEGYQNTRSQTSRQYGRGS